MAMMESGWLVVSHSGIEIIKGGEVWFEPGFEPPVDTNSLRSRTSAWTSLPAKPLSGSSGTAR